MKILGVALLFLFIFPIFPSFSPLPTDRLIELIGLAYFFIGIKNHYFLISNKYLLKVVGLAIILFLVAFLVQIDNIGGFETALIKSSIDLVLMIFGSYFICSIIKRGFKEFSLIRVLEIIVLTFFIQGVISLVFYFQPALYTSFTSTLNTDVSQNLYERLHLSEVRLMGVGNAFFNGVIRYGINLIILTFLHYNNRSIFSRKPYLFLTLYVFFIVVGIMTGRTFFVVVLLSILVIVFYESRRLDKFIVRVVFTPFLLLLITIPFYFVFSNYVEIERLDRTLNFVFELFISYEETGSLSTNSSEATLNMYVFPDNLKTWFFGDGKFINSDGSYYMYTDVGYLRYIYYFGLIGTVIYFLIQLKILSYITKLVAVDGLTLMFTVLFVWILILNLKGIANLDLFAILLLVTAVIEKNARKKNALMMTGVK